MHTALISLILFAFVASSGESLAADSIQEVSRGIYLLPGQLKQDQSPDGNSEIVKGPKGVVVIDTGRNDMHTEQLIEIVKKMHLPLVAVFNTHWHLDHIGGNAQFKKQWPGIHIYAHPSLITALDGFHRDYRVQLEQYLPTLSADSPEHGRYQSELDLLRLDHELVATDDVVDSTTKLLGGRSLEIHISHHSVTEGDLWIWDKSTSTVIAGDLVTLPVPLFDSACPEGWKAALDTIGSKKFTTLVPGHGPVMTRSMFDQYQKAFDELLSCAAQEKSKSTCVDGWFANAHSLVTTTDEQYGRALLSYYFDQFIKPDATGRKRWCAKPSLHR